MPLSIDGIQHGLLLTYNDYTHSFVGTFTTSGKPNWVAGKYTVEIVAYSPIGDFGTAMGSLRVT
jgi:hypothetical protein